MPRKAIVGGGSDAFWVNADQPEGMAIDQMLAARAGDAFAFAERIRDARKSMLAPETLAAIHLLAARCEGPIVEIGAYVGGATLALLDATRGRGNAVISIEYGVAYDHPEIPTDNSVADLRRNVEAWDLAADRHVVMPGWNLEAWLVGNVLLELRGRRAGMLLVDSDGFVDRDLIFLHPLLADGAVLVIDDYLSGDTCGKSEMIAPFVDDMIAKGVMSEIALLPWGTWIGCLINRPDENAIARYRRQWEQAGHPWLAFLDQQRKAQHLPRAKEMKAPLFPWEFTNEETGMEDEKTREKRAIYARVKSIPP
jgi:hypothetical protein